MSTKWKSKMKKRIWIAIFLVTAALTALLLVGCGNLGGGSKGGNTSAPKVLSFSVRRAASGYTEEGEIPCATAANRKIETLLAIVKLDMSDSTRVESVTINGTDYLSNQFIAGANASEVRLRLDIVLPEVGEYESEITEYELKLEKLTYNNGGRTLSLSPTEGNEAKIRINPTFTVTLDVSESGKKPNDEGVVPPIVMNVGFLQEMSLPSTTNMNLSSQLSDIPPEEWDEFGKLGYTFTGWYDEAGNRYETQRYERFSDLTLYAHYAPMFTYRTESDEEGKEYAVITGLHQEARTQAAIYIPRYIDGYPVRKLGSGALVQAGSNALYVHSYAELTEIGDSALKGLSAMRNFVFPATVERIGDYAFDGCSSLATNGITAFSLENISEIGAYAFRNCGFSMRIGSFVREKTLFLSSTLKKIGEGAFYGCAFKTVMISENFVGTSDTVGASLFRNCSDLTTVRFDCSESNPMGNGTEKTSFRHIPDYAFYNCKNLVLSTLPEGVTRIGAYAFTGGGMGSGAGNLSKITSFTLPKSLLSIGEYAFAGSAIAELNIGKDSSLSDLGDYSFSNTKLEEVYIEAPFLVRYGISPFYNTQVGAIFFGAERPPQFAGKGETQLLPESVKYFVPESALESYREEFYLEGVFSYFTGNTPLKVYAREQIYTAQEGNRRFAFEYVEGSGETEVVVTNIFSRESSVTLPELLHITTESGTTKEVRVVGVSEYFTWSTVTEVALPASVRIIGENAFAGCTELRSVSVGGKTAVEGWDGVEEIGAYAFYRTALTSFRSGSSLKRIDDYAFYLCGALRSVDLTKGKVESADTRGDALEGLRVGYGAFQDCKALTELIIGQAVSHIEYQAFAHNAALKRAKIARYSVPKISKTAAVAITRVFDAPSSEFGIVIELPSREAAITFSNCAPSYDKTKGEGYAEWKGYNYTYPGKE